MGRKAILVAALLVGALLFTSCQPEPTPTPTLAPTETPTEAPTETPTEASTEASTEGEEAGEADQPAETLEKDKEAPNFTLTDLEGTERQLSDYRGQYVMLNFWASWCPPCQAEIPYMVDLYNDSDKEFEIVAVNLGEDSERAASFVENSKMTFPVLLDAEGEVAKQYQIRNIPTSYFLRKDGTIQSVHVGTLTEETLQQYVDDLMSP